MKDKGVDLSIKPQEAFYRLRSNSADWTGYNSVVVEEAVTTGLKLAEINAKLEDKLYKTNVSETKAMVSKIAAALVWVAAFATFIFVIYMFIKIDYIEKRGFAMGVQLSEAVRTNTPVEDIHVESSINLPSAFDNRYVEQYWERVTIFIDKRELIK